MLDGQDGSSWIADNALPIRASLRPLSQPRLLRRAHCERGCLIQDNFTHCVLLWATYLMFVSHRPPLGG
jgi:hypothetical protein